jgi:hypothetical protein
MAAIPDRRERYMNPHDLSGVGDTGLTREFLSRSAANRRNE